MNLLEKEHTVAQLEKVQNTAKADTTGSRDAASHSDDHPLDLQTFFSLG